MWRLAIAIGLTVTGVAIAEPADRVEAERTFQLGRELAARGEYDEACKLFARSYGLDPGLGTALNLADCFERQGQLRRAWEMFDVVARKSQSSQRRATLARQRADALSARLTTVVVRLRDPSVAGLAIRIGDRELVPAAEIRDRIDPRDVELVVTAPGRRPYKVMLRAVAGATLSTEIPALAALPDDAMRRRRSRVYLAGGLGAAALAGLGGSLGFGIAASRTHDRAFDHGCQREPLACTPGTSGRGLIDRAGRQADVATALAITGAVLAGASAVVFFTAPRETVIAPIASGRELGLGIVGRF